MTMDTSTIYDSNGIFYFLLLLLLAFIHSGKNKFVCIRNVQLLDQDNVNTRIRLMMELNDNTETLKYRIRCCVN